MDSGVTTLTEGDLIDVEKTVWDATWEVVDEAMVEHQIVCGELHT